MAPEISECPRDTDGDLLGEKVLTRLPRHGGRLGQFRTPGPGTYYLYVHHPAKQYFTEACSPVLELTPAGGAPTAVNVWAVRPGAVEMSNRAQAGGHWT